MGVMAAFEPADAGVQKSCLGCKKLPRGVKKNSRVQIFLQGCKNDPKGANFILEGAEIRIGWYLDSNRNNRGISTPHQTSWADSD